MELACVQGDTPGELVAYPASLVRENWQRNFCAKEEVRFKDTTKRMPACLKDRPASVKWDEKRRDCTVHNTRKNRDAPRTPVERFTERQTAKSLKSSS